MGLSHYSVCKNINRWNIEDRRTIAYVCVFSLTTQFCTQVCLMVTMETCIRHLFLMSSKSPVFLKQICLQIRECVPVVFKGLWGGCALEIDRLPSDASRRSAKRETQRPHLLHALTFYCPLHNIPPVITVPGHLNPF